MNELIAPDFFEFGRSGHVYLRQDTLAATRQPAKAAFPLPELNIRLISKDTAQVTYNSAVTYDDIVEYARRSSIWSRTADGWTLRFHQDTPFEP